MEDLSQISAEFLIHYLYPADEALEVPPLGGLRGAVLWRVAANGSFYRNYNPDLMELDAAQHTVSLSRNGFLQLLPQGMLTEEDELTSSLKSVNSSGDMKENDAHLHLRLRLLAEAFMPIDSFYFREKLKREGRVARWLSHRTEQVLTAYFDFDLAAVQNRYVQSVAGLLPFVCWLKGDMDWLRRLLSALFGCATEMRTSCHRADDRLSAYLPSVELSLLIPDLSAESYRKLSAEIQPLADFLTEWFLPFDLHCEIKVREHRHSGMTLGYNVSLI